MNVIVTDYNPKWPLHFEEERKHVEKIVGDNLVRVHHIGSTAVENLAAKPVIDMLLVVKSLDALDALNSEFELLGYECMHEFGMPGRRYYRKGGDDRTHQIHAFHYTNLNETERHLIFRDYLRSHPDVRDDYAVIKKKSALNHPKDINAYGDEKESFIKQAESDALLWHYKNR